MKILFLGNSITRHGQKTEIGWDGDYGMAASRPENDYAHRLCAMLEDRGKHTAAKIENVSFFELEPTEENAEAFRRFVSFGADVTVIRLGENVPREKTKDFIRLLPSVIRLLSHSRVFVAGCFWENEELDGGIRRAAQECGVPFVSLAPAQGEEYQARGLFAHKGVAAHPSDRGMNAIAEILFGAMEDAGLLSAPEIPLFTDETEKTDYAVTADGREVKCHPCRVSAMSFNTVWPGHQRPAEQTEVSSFVSFASDFPVDIRVRLPRRPQSLTIRPLSRETEYELNGDIVYFTLRRPGQYVLECDGRRNVLHIFADEKKSFDHENATYRFVSGVYDAGKIHLNSGESVYIGADALVYGEIDAKDAENVKIFGRGILDGSKYPRTTADCDIGGSGLINFARCKNVSVQGVILRDSRMWTATMINCEGVTFDGVKVIGMWRYNSDGFDFVNSRGVVVKNCFLRTFDDGIVLKGLYFGGTRETEKMSPAHYLIENCTVWCDWGGALEIGAETVADEYHDIVFRDCDILRNDQGAMRIHSGDRADIHDLTYENIRVEYSAFDRRNIYQENDEMTYDPGDRPACAEFFKAWMYCGTWSPDNIPGHVHDVTVRDIKIYKDASVAVPEILLNGYGENNLIENVTFENLTLNGRPFTPAVNKNEFVKNIKI